MKLQKVHFLQITNSFKQIKFTRNNFLTTQNNFLFSEKYRKTTFDWQSSPAPKKFGSYSNQNKNKYPTQTQAKNQAEKHNNFNPNESMMSQILKLKSTQSFCNFYLENKQYFNPRMLSFAARYLCSLIDKQKMNSSFNSSESIGKLHKFLDEVISCNPKNKPEEIRNQQMKNLLYFTKKILNEQIKLFHLQQDDQYFNEELLQKVFKFRNELVSLYLHPSFDFSFYEVNEVVEIYHELIRLSATLQISQIYKHILQRKQKIQSNINPQFLFSATNFMLTVKTIEFNEEKTSWRNNQNANHKFDKNSLQKLFPKKSVQQLKDIKDLRQKCYEVFFNKWMYYYEDMNEFIKLNDMLYIWPVILLSNTGIKMILKGKNGPRVLQFVNKILKNHNSTLQAMIQNHSRVISNSLVALYLLSKKYPTHLIVDESFRRGRKVMQQLHNVQKNKAKIRIKTFLNGLRRQKIINQNQQMEGLQFISIL